MNLITPSISGDVVPNVSELLRRMGRHFDLPNAEEEELASGLVACRVCTGSARSQAAGWSQSDSERGGTEQAGWIGAWLERKPRSVWIKFVRITQITYCLTAYVGQR